MSTPNKDDVARGRLDTLVSTLWILGWSCVVATVWVWLGWKAAVLLAGGLLLFHAVAIANISRDES